MPASVTANQQVPLRVALQRLSKIKANSGISSRPLAVTSFLSGITAMSSSSENPQRAPWRDLLDSQLKQTPGYEFTIATIGYDSQQRPVPRLRTCGCRGFFPELELHPKGQEAMDQQVERGGNPSVYESDMLTFTTDARMEKLPQLESSGQAIEAVFWLKDLMTQWRIKGTAYAIGNPQGEDAEDERNSRQEIKKALRATNNDNSLSTWTWEKAVTKYFANHSPVARGSFRNPPPGQPKHLNPSNSELKLGQKVTDLHDPVARANFRVVVIKPEEVERLDLTDQDNGKRWNWKIIGSNDTSTCWNETEVWP
ncbi:unnamed protein product [Penicillium salamii]|uniref:Pyridoxamine 5'-phosphate oxidase Alr4036 family FMN-binding domain-containing protein n=1 Tax=Penicillium salamii TaxID=1612424 RepID=A0A9W4NF48_9EURO|nr:unnamed protein product [Penicillium salamii]CAG8243518.1 unnamed protein product [Penicillium salamii]CAG8301570.1 unnamed protein product [Penicillium salamii]CAG8327707.1 unnamed protein product [Penicillium salamii]CAG8334724.1 unnamed protein product [Penicillium salamii]